MDDDSNEDKSVDSLLFVYLITGLSQVSNRLYYLYYRILQTMAGEQESLSKFLLGAVATGVAFVAALIDVEVAALGFSLDLKMGILLASIVFWVAVVLMADRYWIPKRNWERTQATVRLGIHLSEINTAVQQLNLMNAVPTRYTQLASSLRADDLNRLKSAVELTRELIKELESMTIYEQALKELKESRTGIEGLLKEADSKIAEGHR